MSIQLCWFLIFAFQIINGSEYYPIQNSTIDTNKRTFQPNMYENQELCLCNLNIGLCDNQCCCDPDCPQALKTEFQQKHLCRVNVMTNIHCISRQYLIYFNARIGIKENKNYEVNSNQICIELDQVGLTQYSFQNEISLTQQQANNIAMKDPIQAQFRKQQQDIKTGVINNNRFKNIKYANNVDLDLVFPLINQQCNLETRLKFLVNQQTFSCYLKLKIKDQCVKNGLLDLNYYKKILNSASLQSEYKYFKIQSNNKIVEINSEPTITLSGVNNPCQCQNMLDSLLYKLIVKDESIQKVMVQVYYKDQTGVCDTEIIQYFNFGYGFYNQNYQKIQGLDYQQDQIVYVGKQKDNSYIETEMDGLAIQYSDSSGRCIYEAGYQSEYNPSTDSRLRFLNSQVFSCYQTVNSLKEFQDLCQQSSLQKLKVFNNFEKDMQIARFGNPNVNYVKDWTKIQIESQKIAVELSGNVCKMPSQLNMIISYEKVGVTDRAVTILSGAQQFYSDNSEFVYDGQRGENKLYFKLKIEYFSLNKNEQVKNKMPIFPHLPLDVFNPISMKSMNQYLDMMFLLVLVYLN